MGPMGLLDFSLIVSDLGLGAVVTALIVMVSIGLEELPSLGRGDLQFWPSHLARWLLLRVWGVTLGGHSQKVVMGEVVKYLVHGNDPGVGDEVCPCVGDDKNVPEHI